MATGAAEGDPKVMRASPRPKIRLSPVGFWSYSRRDDELSRGRLSRLRSLLLAELQTQYGLDGIQLFQDASAIPHGADWERLITGAIDQSTFFIPIVTPFYMQSLWCARETKMFEARERAIFEAHPDLSRDRRRIFPLLWIGVKDVEAIDGTVAAALKVAQWCDFSHLRHRNLEHDEEVLAAVAAFAKSIVDVLQLRVAAPLTEEEVAQIAVAEAARAREDEQRKAVEAEARTSRLAEAVAAEERRRHELAAAARAGQDHPSLPRTHFPRLARWFQPQRRWMGAAVATATVAAVASTLALFAAGGGQAPGSPKAAAGDSEAINSVQENREGSARPGSHESSIRQEWLTGQEVRQSFLNNYLCSDFRSATNDCDWLVYGLSSSMTDPSRFEVRLDRKYEVRDASIARRSYGLAFDPDFVIVSSIEQMATRADRVCATEDQPDFGREIVYFGSADGRMANLTGADLQRFRDAFGTYRLPRHNAQDCWRYQVRQEGGETHLYQFAGNSSASGRWFTTSGRAGGLPGLRIARWGD